MMSKLTTADALALGLSGGAAQAQELYIGQFAPVGFCFCPRGTTEAAGQLMAISENTALFSLLGTTYGDDERTTFALPDLRRRAPIGQGPGPGVGNHRQGNKGGQEAVSITTNQMPSHAHGGAGAPTGSPPRHAAPSPARHGAHADHHVAQLCTAYRGQGRHGREQRDHDHRRHRRRGRRAGHGSVPRHQVLHRDAGDVPLTPLMRLA